MNFTGMIRNGACGSSSYSTPTEACRHTEGKLSHPDTIYAPMMYQPAPCAVQEERKRVGNERIDWGTIAAGFAAHQAGNLGQAEKLYREVLSTDRNQFDAKRLLGVLQFQRGNPEEAERLLRQALKISPNDAETNNDHGTALLNLKRYDKAVASFDKAIRLKPDLPDARYNRGTAMLELRRFRDALVDFDSAIRLRPNFALAHYNRGHALRKLDRLEEALSSNETALTLNPSAVDVWVARGTLLIEMGQHAAALDVYDKALRLDPASLDARLGLGNVLRLLKRDVEALAVYDQVFAMKPDLTNGLIGRGNVLARLKRYEEALASYDQALAIKVQIDSLIGRGSVLGATYRIDDALKCFDDAIAIEPNSHISWRRRGAALAAMHRDADALASYDRALAIRPDYAEARHNKGVLKLSLGDYAEGWQLYEFRPNLTRNFDQPRWRGDDASGKTILIHSEQGLGDTIQFYRYLPLVLRNDCRVIFETFKPLISLFRDQQIGNTDVVERGEPLQHFDMHCPLLSLPLVFGTTLETVPAFTSYIAANEEKTTFWRTLLGEKNKPRIGLAWSGNPQFDDDINRSMRLKSLLPIMTDAADWFSLQKDVRDHDLEQLATSPLHDHSSHFKDFSDTAALVSTLDLVISVDTSVGHLGGALGKPVWILLPFDPDFRWMRNRSDSPWYPTAKLFRRTRRDVWSDVLEQVSAELVKWGGRPAKQP
jgi:tetratricopeptide (TPR) repeat protein